MTRSEFILASLSVSSGAEYQPVQIQKMFFLLDENLGEFLGGRMFSFEPYNYGPYDPNLYREFKSLAELGQAKIDIPRSGSRKYSLTVEGQKAGEAAIAEFPDNIRKYISDVDQYVRRLSFKELVTAIYKAYPEMKSKSI